MAQPDRLQDPDEPEGREPRSRGRQPDWLIGADADVGADDVSKPGAAPFERRPPGRAPEPSARELPGGPVSKAVRWTGAASSVPRLREVTQTPASPHAPDHEPDLAEESPPGEDFLDGPLDAEAGAARVARGQGPASGRPAPRSRPTREPFWVVWLDLLASDRRIQTVTGLAFIVVLALVFWPRNSGVSIAALKHHPAAYEGRAVRVQGRIGDVFVVGQGYVFNLHQGRDTLVVFTRLRSPRSRERTTVVGSVSTGYLDGVARVALFETEAPGAR